MSNLFFSGEISIPKVESILKFKASSNFLYKIFNLKRTEARFTLLGQREVLEQRLDRH